MKKLFLATAIIGTVLIGCKKDDSGGSSKFCWEFNMTTTITVAGTVQSTTSSKATQCNLTEDEAEQIRRGSEQTTTSGNATSKTTTTKQKI